MQENKNKPTLKLDWCSHKAAKYACEHWHYSGVIPVGKLVKVGVWENDKFIGIVLFGRGANNNMLKPYNLKQDEGCELVRIALKRHKMPVSQIMMIAIKFLKNSNPKLKLIVSYADEDQNHKGTIYQATNWIYEGLFNKGSMGAFIINGKKTHPKSVHSKGIKQNLESVKKYLDKNATIFYTNGKHKYLYPLTKQMRKQIEPLAKPYPKKLYADTLEKDSGDQLEKGGANPTCPLHLKATNAS